MSKWVTMKWKGVGMRRGERTMERHVINARLNCQCHDFGSICWFINARLNCQCHDFGSICWFIRNKNFDYTPDMMTSANGCIFRVSGLLWALMVSLICAWTNGWTNYRDAGDLRRHRAHHDVTVMCGYNTFRFYQLLLLQWLKSRPSPHDSQLFEVKTKYLVFFPLRWRHNGRDSVSNHLPHDCLLNRLFRRRSKKTSKLRVTGLCAGTSPGTGEFPAQMASNAENVSIWWRNHALDLSSNWMTQRWYDKNENRCFVWINGLTYHLTTSQADASRECES